MKRWINLTLTVLLLFTFIVFQKETVQASDEDASLLKHLEGQWETRLIINNVDFTEPSILTKESFYARNGEIETVKFSLAGETILLSVGTAGDIQNIPLTLQDGKYVYKKIYGQGPNAIDQLVVDLKVTIVGNRMGFIINSLREVRAPDHFLVLDFSYKNTSPKEIELPASASEKVESAQENLKAMAARLWKSLKEALAGESFQVQTPSATCGVRG